MFYGGKLIWFWCFWPEGSGAGLKLMQDTNGSGKEMYCAESMAEEMFYIYLCQFACVKEWFIEEIQGTESPKSQNLGKSWKFWGKKNICLGTPLGAGEQIHPIQIPPPKKSLTFPQGEGPPSYVCWWDPLHYTSSSTTIEFTKLVNFSTLNRPLNPRKKKTPFSCHFLTASRPEMLSFTPIPKPSLAPASHIAGRQPRFGDALSGALTAAACRVALALPALAAPDEAEGALSWDGMILWQWDDVPSGKLKTWYPLVYNGIYSDSMGFIVI